MSNKNYKEGKRAYSSNNVNSFDSKLMKAFYKKEYLEQLEREQRNSNTTPKVNLNTKRSCSTTKKVFITLFILLLIIGSTRNFIFYAIYKKGS